MAKSSRCFPLFLLLGVAAQSVAAVTDGKNLSFEILFFPFKYPHEINGGVDPHVHIVHGPCSSQLRFVFRALSCMLGIVTETAVPFRLIKTSL
jgi:hypothetical protein